jgi:hypothetical protein
MQDREICCQALVWWKSLHDFNPLITGSMMY